MRTKSTRSEAGLRLQVVGEITPTDLPRLKTTLLAALADAGDVLTFDVREVTGSSLPLAQMMVSTVKSAQSRRCRLRVLAQEGGPFIAHVALAGLGVCTGLVTDEDAKGAGA